MANSNSNETAAAAGATYDETPYPSSTFPQTHPDKLCAMARLFGLQAAAPGQSRVLELGCADGANLLPMAQHLPISRFVGIDASAKQVATAQAAIKGSGLSNIEIRQQNILEFPTSEGKFDYIIAHGIYSWVPEDVRVKILAICREHLAENGVAYISYNAFPGWGMRMALRDMMFFHTAKLKDSKQKVQQARALTGFLADAVPTDNNPYGLLLKQELDRMKTKADNYLRHDILEEVNQPFYFHQFATQAAHANLQYLGEPSLDQMLASNFSEKTRETLQKVGSSLVAQEQYMDFVRNRNFRQTLLCHREAKLNRKIAPQILKGFVYTSKLAKPKPAALDLAPGVPHTFHVSGDTSTLTVENSFVKAALSILAERSIRRISFSELLQAAREMSSAQPSPDEPARRAAVEEATLTHNLMRLYSRGFVEIFAGDTTLSPKLPEKPSATPLARYQALNSRLAATRVHNAGALDLITRYILASCDGSRDRDQIVEHLVSLAKSGKLRLGEGGKPIEDKAVIRKILENRVQLLLPRLAAAGFF